jgi:hypothetical protein
MFSRSIEFALFVAVLFHTSARAEEPKKKEEPYTVWGKEVGGLQAGLGFEPGHKRDHQPGESLKLIVRVRNVGRQEVSFQYLRHFFIENPPAVKNGDGESLVLKDGTTKGVYKVEDATLAPGKELELYEFFLTLGDKAPDSPNDSTLYGEGKYTLQYERILGNSGLTSVSIKFPPELKDLATGKLELEVKKAK